MKKNRVCLKNAEISVENELLQLGFSAFFVIAMCSEGAASGRSCRYI